MNDDETLVAALLASGDETTFRSLYRRHTPALYGLALRLTGYVESDAEDAVQEAWVRAIERLGAFRWESSLRTWLCAIVVNCTREIVRRRRRDAGGGSLDAGSVHGSRPEPAARLDLERAIAGLPDGYREVLVLHDVEGYTHQEIGELLGVTAGTSKSQLFHARKAMRAALSGRRADRGEEHADG